MMNAKVDFFSKIVLSLYTFKENLKNFILLFRINCKQEG